MLEGEVSDRHRKKMYPFHLGLCSPRHTPKSLWQAPSTPVASSSFRFSLFSFSLTSFLAFFCTSQSGDLAVRQWTDRNWKKDKYCQSSAGLCVCWDPIMASMCLQCYRIMKSNGLVERWLVGQWGQRVTVQMSHSSNQCHQEWACVPGS